MSVRDDDKGTLPVGPLPDMPCSEEGCGKTFNILTRNQVLGTNRVICPSCKAKRLRLRAEEKVEEFEDEIKKIQQGFSQLPLFPNGAANKRGRKAQQESFASA